MPRPKGLPKTGGRQKGGVDKIKREAILAAQGIIADWREPNVIRLAPVPLYNSFADVDRVGAALRQFFS